MATLHLKNLPDKLYRQLAARSRKHGRTMAEEVLQILSDALAEKLPLTLLDLKGLGKAAWKDVDPPRHVESER